LIGGLIVAVVGGLAEVLESRMILSCAIVQLFVRAQGFKYATSPLTLP
jgi:hypothetical protein